MPLQKHEKKINTVFGHINRADGLEKQLWGGNNVVPKAEEDNPQNISTV